MSQESIPSSSRSKGLILRPATFAETWAMGRLAKNAYSNTPVDSFLFPFQKTYPADHIRAYREIAAPRLFNPRCLSYIVYEEDEAVAETRQGNSKRKVKGEPIAYGQYVRLGDGGLTMQPWHWYWTIAGWLWGAWLKLCQWMWPNRAASTAAGKKLGEGHEIDHARYWAGRDDVKESWRVLSVIVSEEWRGKGVGSLLMKPAMERAEQEGVTVQLSASPMGERLYRKLGFELLGKFSIQIGDEEGGGHMMWTPESLRRRKATELDKKTVS